MRKLQFIHPKQNQNQIMYESNKLGMLQTQKKALDVLKIIKTISSTS